MNKKIRLVHSIHFKIPMLFILLLLVSLQLIGAYFIRELETKMISNFDSQMSLNAGFLEKTLQPILMADDTEKLEESVQTILSDFTGANILETQVMDEQGYILGINDQTLQSLIGTKSTDRDVQQVILLDAPSSYQYVKEDTNSRVLKNISPIYSMDNTGTLIGVLVMESNIESVYSQMSQTVSIFLNASVVAIIITIVLAVIISRGITRPISEMRRQTANIADGDYSGKVTVYGADELGELAETINDLSYKVKDAQETTESERQRLDSVLRHMTDGVLATDRRGKIIIINSRAMDLLSISQDKAIGQSIMKVLKLGEKFTFRQLLETQDELILNIPTDDQDTILRGEFSVIQRESGFISGLVCVLSDITEQEKVEQERRSFVSNVSHELRTPLTSVKSYTESLIDGAWEDEEIAPEFLKVISTETDRMIRMITDLLNLSRMDQGKQDLNREFVSINELVAHIIDRFEMVLKSEQYRNKKYTIERDFTQRTLWVEIDQDKFIQVIDNIMNNAIKYSPDGGKITCKLMETHNSVVISITDEGLGIPRKDIGHVFDRFYRVDKARARSMGGTGLGLAISKEVVQLHGGKIWVTSVENKGSTFFISLPYIPMDEEDEWG
ncbi:MAG: cell wall metabolism sensor histidine kinase WalK [Trichococcus flocculiformis]|jgi:two-component system sensor histidine kinase VicK|uniref:histidine kinase n=1 Tax=Trichococcus flocculiformis TaxID=82803 RepID=A0AB38BGY0_9LACT|nr:MULTISPECIES: cell wall metabolism sensor histidine kinase WalK [Trichococcus]MBP6164790.1 cell wall metabolism sensor histidine kinase WalK [Trichococcus sp.]NCB65918.1 cell wall metabolism sensor histidine kinase WalK [Bacilli bacterium]MBP6246767.1 cell wall metabolism sensor histidine kinase WalK [Trichococcus sp.]MBP7128071.1 cell wall metabolism sensor histidine kinase WalK [Trichococcus sp.]MBP8682464.1 cell wall metabolism sensor histidine kinase WalK [Trichococcus sp.]